MIGKLIVHTSIYSIGNLLISLAGFISFPILTRIFSVDDYGAMNFIAVNLSLLVAISKLGVQHAVPRFYGEIKSKKIDYHLNNFYSTVVIGMTGSGVIFALIFIIIVQIIPRKILGGSEIVYELINFAIPSLVIIKTCDSSLINILRAEERSGIYTIYTVIKRYLSLTVILVTLLYFVKNLYGFYFASTAIEAITVVVLLCTPVFRSKNLSFFSFSPKLYKMMLVFGIPMIGYELSGIILNVGDRYVINILLGDYALGNYSAAYNMCEYIGVILTSSIAQAALPIYVNFWETKGELETKKFLNNSISAYLMVGIPVVVGLDLIGNDLLHLLASSKYQIDSKLISLISAGLIFDGMTIFFAAGLYITKNTFKISQIIGASAVLNILINFLLVPSIGLIGSAIATLISYIFLGITMIFSSRKKLLIPFPFLDTMKYCIFSVFMYFIVMWIEMSNVILTIISKVFIGSILYFLLIFLFHRKAFVFILDLKRGQTINNRS